MLPIFANPAGLWVLLALPAILAIHFLQQRAKVARTSTWFLIEKLAPDSARGRTWDRLRGSRTLWLQLLAVLLAAWILGEPRWVRTESAQTVVVVLDASVALQAFRAPALAAAERELSMADGLAARTTWVVMTTNPRQPALYRGLERAAAGAALARWQPDLGWHDPGPALRLARTLAGATGRTLLITDSRAKVPPDQRAVGVGQPLDNVGFGGATVTREENGLVWRALIKNHAATAQRRTWQLEVAGAKSPEQAIELAAGALAEISARVPDGVERATVVLSVDGFAADNFLPLVVPRPKPLTVSVDGGDAAGEFLRKLAEAVDGVVLNPPAGASPATLRLGRLSAAEVAQEARGGIFWPPADQRAQAPLLAESVTAERDALVAGLNWQGWFGTGPYGFAAAAGDTPLLWQGKWPLVFLRRNATTATGESPAVVPARKLMLAFDWATSNAARLPATVLLARRFLEAERDAQRAPFAANFDCGAPILLASGWSEGAFTLTFEPSDAKPEDPPIVTAITPAELAGLRAPGRAGFFTVRRGDEIVVRGSAQFADTRQGDFRAAERFSIDFGSERAAALERHTAPDPWVAAWLALLAAVMLGSWWGGHGRGEKNLGRTNLGGSVSSPAASLGDTAPTAFSR